MSRALVVAKAEFLMLVRTKAFIIGVLMAPIMIGLSIGFQAFAARRGDVDDHRLAVIDRTGVLYATLAQAAAEHNAAAGDGAARTGPHFLLSRVDDRAASADVAVDLSAQVRNKTLFAFVDIPASVLNPQRAEGERIDYYTETPSYGALPGWLGTVLQKAINARRLAGAAVDPAIIAALTRPADVATLGLVDKNPDGTIREAKRVNQLATFAVPFGMMYLLFIALMSSAPQLLSAVIEEKMSRISEVLIASITPFQLMAGKLIGVAALSALLALIYFGIATYAALSSGQMDFIRPALMGWFVVFLLCAVLMFGSVFVAIGAACSDLKDSQTMMQPVMVLLLLPMLASPIVLRSPGSTMSVIASLVPTATPFLMLLRLAMTPPPPLWQVGLSVALTLSAATLFVWAAARIFRVGLLMQGKPPNLPELLRWIRQ
ncbi:MAG: ABC transporter permease [Vicinamibacterales bacterium]